MEGRTNGVVFSDTNLYGVRGTNKGSKYEDDLGNLKYQGRVLATNIGSNKKMEIRDSILQYYDGTGVDEKGDPLNDGKNRLVPGNESPEPDHILGLIASQIEIKPSGKSQNYQNSSTTRRERTVDGIPFGGGDFKGGYAVYAVMMAGFTDSDGNVQGGFGAHESAMQDNDNLGDFNLYGGIISGESKNTQSQKKGKNHGFRLSLNYDKLAAAFLRYFPKTTEVKPLRYVTYKPAIKSILP